MFWPPPISACSLRRLRSWSRSSVVSMFSHSTKLPIIHALERVYLRRLIQVKRLNSRGMGPLRIVVAKPGLDGHDRGAKVVARALRDAGHEVIYTGLRRTPEEIIRIVEDEDASILGLSSLSGAHGFLFPRVCDLLRENGLNDIVVFGGGIIPMADRPDLFSSGVRAIFGPGTPTEEFLHFLNEVKKRRISNEPVGVGFSDGWHWR